MRCLLFLTLFAVSTNAFSSDGLSRELRPKSEWSIMINTVNLKNGLVLSPTLQVTGHPTSVEVEGDDLVISVDGELHSITSVIEKSVILVKNQTCRIPVSLINETNITVNDFKRKVMDRSIAVMCNYEGVLNHQHFKSFSIFLEIPRGLKVLLLNLNKVINPDAIFMSVYPDVSRDLGEYRVITVVGGDYADGGTTIGTICSEVNNVNSTGVWKQLEQLGASTDKTLSCFTSGSNSGLTQSGSLSLRILSLE